MKRIGLLGKKLGMSQIFDQEGHCLPVTLLEVGPCYVTALRTKEKDGYSAVQIGFDPAREKRVSKPVQGQAKKAGTPLLRRIKEIRTDEIEGLAPGAKLTVDNFEAGDWVDVRGTSIGRGFQGVVKRHHFKGSLSKSHGSMFGRVPGSIGASSFPSRVIKGMKAAGHMGNKPITIQNIRVLKVDQESNVLMLHGSVPGAEEGYLLIQTALKKGDAQRKWKVQASAVKDESSGKAKTSGGSSEAPHENVSSEGSPQETEKS